MAKERRFVTVTTTIDGRPIEGRRYGTCGQGPLAPGRK
jgi:hypothetical protein